MTVLLQAIGRSPWAEPQVHDPRPHVGCSCRSAGAAVTTGREASTALREIVSGNRTEGCEVRVVRSHIPGFVNAFLRLIIGLRQ